MTLGYFLTQKTVILKQDFKGEDRKAHNKNISGIEIDIEQLNLPSHDQKVIVMERPTAFRGVVIPLETKGRKPAPDPVAFDSLAKYIKSVTKQRRFKLLSSYSDRGHIFALELGGPNSKYNIIPQWSGFQKNGDWRSLERNIKNNAKTLLKDNNSIFLEVNIEYMNLNLRDLASQFENIFSFKNHFDYNEAKVKKCLQIFGLPLSYSIDSYPCSVYIRKPRNHSLSISYVKYLFDVAKEIHLDGQIKNFDLKAKAAQKKLNRGWGIKKLVPSDLVNINKSLLNIDNFCIKGKLSLSALTEEDL